ncbi:uncharacterized protein N0V89_004601 [Didymosphaeria variabile]|uniref:EthD domain-containing protein n=1 Tax=Didymosphaeria variabile TaxID=1932322 RepID=A0A9W8XQU5_9PLEO|nr:uncharacterized protein N0V89_004601 [Didymosphaeria variabile]KAJ4356567.1 hypothetical protein N0V89_004601 [Didymosphaeria variabile]
MVQALICLFSKREDLTFNEFREAMETRFVPLLEKLTGPLFPLTYSRRYIAADGNARERHRSGPLGLPSLIVGEAESITWDALIEATFEDDLHLQQFMSFINESEAAEELMECESSFSDSGRLRIIVMENNVSA